MYGLGGNDALTGSSTKANTIYGGAGNDTITGGSVADVIDGGEGTDTFVANLAEQAGASTTVGAVINLSADALTQASVFTATGNYLTGAAPTVAAGTATYLFDTESTTNASVVDTLVSIENVTGTTGTDYIVGSTGVNVINGGAGADVLTGNGGNDVFAFADNQSTTAAADSITDYALGDIIRLVAADNVAGASVAAGTEATSNVEVSAGGKVTFAAADDTLAEMLVALAADTTDIATNEVVFFELGADTYIFNNVGGTDDLIKLVGVTGFTTLTESATTAGDFTLA